MKIVRYSETEKIKNSDTSNLIEYSTKLLDKDIDCGVNVINGRYPEKGYAVNEECKELVYILEGTGTINKKDEMIKFAKDDVILIDKGEYYYWDGNCKIILICTPAWSKAQCKVVEL